MSSFLAELIDTYWLVFTSHTWRYTWDMNTDSYRKRESSFFTIRNGRLCRLRYQFASRECLGKSICSLYIKRQTRGTKWRRLVSEIMIPQREGLLRREDYWIARDNANGGHFHRNIKIICHYFNKSVPLRVSRCSPASSSSSFPFLLSPYRSPLDPPSRAPPSAKQAVADVTVPLMSALFFTSIFIPFIGCPLHKLSAGY